MRLVILFLTLLTSTMFTETVNAQTAADAIYHGGDVVTIDDKNPTAEAVAIRDGKVIGVGTKADMLKMKGDNTKLIDLEGKSLLPGFVDAHGHCFNVGVQAAAANLLCPPDHNVKDIPGIVAELKKWGEAGFAAKYKIFLGMGYEELAFGALADEPAAGIALPLVLEPNVDGWLAQAQLDAYQAKHATSSLVQNVDLHRRRLTVEY